MLQFVLWQNWCAMPKDRSSGQNQIQALCIEDLRELHTMCREGRLYEIERWVAEGKPLQFTPVAKPKGMRPKSALQVAIQTGQHSLALLLLRSGYDLDLEPHPVIDISLEFRRYDLLDLLLEYGADPRSADAYTLLDTYNSDLYERFWNGGYDFTADHALSAYLGEHTNNRPLLGFVKRHWPNNPKIQAELNIALGCHVRSENEKGVSLSIWAGADPHAPAPYPEWDLDDNETEVDEDSFLGWTAVEEAARTGIVTLLIKLRPDPRLDDFDSLYQMARGASVVDLLLEYQAPKDLTKILSSHVNILNRRIYPHTYDTVGAIEAILNCGTQWSERNRDTLGHIRRNLLKADDYDLKCIMKLLKKSEACAPETYQELIRTPKMQERLLAIGILRQRISDRERRENEINRLLIRYDREKLYEQIWSQPVQHLAKSYGISGVALGKTCRKLCIPVPPRGYWARVQAGRTENKPCLPNLS